MGRGKGSSQKKETVWCCIASGPSLTKADCDYIRSLNIKTIVVNDGYRIAPWADILYACDADWWDTHYQAAVKAFKGKKYTKTDKNPALNAAKDYKLQRIKGENADGLGEKSLHYGKNSGYQAINLAYILGATKIILLGYDMGVTRQTHWFGDHPKSLQKNSPFSDFISAFNRMKPENHNLEIINCTRQTALTCFPRVALENVF